MSQITQNVFFSICVKDYFEVLEEMTGDTGYRNQMWKVLRYSELDEKYIFPFEKVSRVEINKDITVGEMMYAAAKMLLLDGYAEEIDIKNETHQMIVDTGTMILEELMIKPLERIGQMQSAAGVENKSTAESMQTCW